LLTPVVRLAPVREPGFSFHHGFQPSKNFRVAGRRHDPRLFPNLKDN